jgi:hypothetical protein
MGRMLKTGMGAVAGMAASVGGALIPAGPAGAHFFYLESPGGAGLVTVNDDHYSASLCVDSRGATAEYLMSTLVIHRRSGAGGCFPDGFGERILRVRVCDFAGCTGWKNV